MSQNVKTAEKEPSERTGAEPRPKLRIAAVVMNSVTRDSRVLKEADSLAAGGFEVTIFGIQDNNFNDPRSERDSGVAIIRVDWKERTYRLMSRVFLATGALAALLPVLLYVFLFDSVFAPLLTSRTFALWGGAAVLALLIFAPPLLLYLRFSAVANRLRAARTNVALARSASQRATKGLQARVDSFLRLSQSMVTRRVRRRCLVERILDYKPDIVHCHDANTLAIGKACRNRLGCRVVFDSHELFEETSLIHPLDKRLSKWVLRHHSGRVQRLVTINDSIAAHMLQTYPQLPPPVIIKNATRLPRDMPEYDGRMHEAAGLEPGSKILLYQGGFAQKRGLPALIKSCTLLPDDWWLVMMGWGAFEGPLKRLAGSIDPEGRRVRFIPGAPQNELLRWTMGGSLGVIPYENVCLNHWYCTPNKLWEFPVAGVPILVSPFPELRKPVEAYGIGRLLSDPATPENIAEVVASIDDRELREMKENCRAYLEADHWEIYASRLVAMYDELHDSSSNSARVQAS